MNRRLIPIGLGLGALVALTLATQPATASPTPYPGAATPAAALVSCPTDDVCGVAGQDGNGDAMTNNAQFIYAEPNNQGGEDFGGEAIDKCSGGDTVTSTCPFHNTSQDAALKGHLIIQIVYVANNPTCVGGSSNTVVTPSLVACNNPTTGTGGGVDTAFVQAGNHSLVDVGETNAETNTWFQVNQDPAGTPDEYSVGGSGATQWTCAGGLC